MHVGHDLVKRGVLALVDGIHDCSVPVKMLHLSYRQITSVI